MLFVFEGTDGVGKTTLINKVADRISNNTTRNVVIMSDPSKELDCTKAIREEVFKNRYTVEDAAVLFKAARIVLEKKIIETKLTCGPGAIILLDRYWPSTAIYQYGGVQCDYRKEIIELMTESLGVDEYFLITDRPKNILSKIENRAEVKNHYDIDEEEDIRYMQKQYRLLFKVMKLMDLGTFSEFHLANSDESDIVERIFEVEENANDSIYKCRT